MTYENIGVRIDNIVLTNLKINEIRDINYLKKLGIVKLNDSGIALSTESGDRYSSISLIGAEDQFDKLSVYASPRKGLVSKICITPQSPETGNLVGFTVPELIVHTETIKKSLLEKYGIDVDFSDSFISRIEIQSTIELEKEITEYQRPLSLITATLPPRCKKDFEVYDVYKNDGLERGGVSHYTNSGKRGIAVRLYDKTAELKACGYTIDCQYLRYEIRINGNVKKKLGTNNVFALSQSDIELYFFSFFFNNVKNKFKACKEDRLRKVERIAVDCRGSRCWRSDLILRLLDIEANNKVPLVLDASEIIEALKRLESRKKHTDIRQKIYNNSRAVKQICKKNGLVFDKMDSKKIEEVFIKFMEGGEEYVNA